MNKCGPAYFIFSCELIETEQKHAIFWVYFFSVIILSNFYLERRRLVKIVTAYLSTLIFWFVYFKINKLQIIHFCNTWDIKEIKQGIEQIIPTHKKSHSALLVQRKGGTKKREHTLKERHLLFFSFLYFLPLSSQEQNWKLVSPNTNNIL